MVSAADEQVSLSTEEQKVNYDDNRRLQEAHYQLRLRAERAYEDISDYDDPPWFSLSIHQKAIWVQIAATLMTKEEMK